MHENQPLSIKTRARIMIDPHSSKQLSLSEFDWPFQVALDEDNRWVKLAQLIPIKTVIIASLTLFVTACYFYGVSKRPTEMVITIDVSSCTELTQSGIDCDGTVTQ